MAKARKYGWDPRAARFRDPATGRYISREQVRRGVDDLVRASQNEITRISDDVRAGRITVAEWNEAMRLELKRAHLGSEALLRGGWKQLGPADYGRVGARLKVQYKYLARFSEQLASGKIRTDGAFMARARSYAASARAAFYKSLGPMLEDLGYTEERNALHPAEHCQQCRDMSALGWVPIGTCVPIGERECRANDKCSMRYR
jgi:hypothetical protein